MIRKKYLKNTDRDLYLELTHHHCIYYSIGLSSVEEIDNLNIIQSQSVCHEKTLKLSSAFWLNFSLMGHKPSWNYNTQAIIKGDQKKVFLLLQLQLLLKLIVII